MWKYILFTGFVLFFISGYAQKDYLSDRDDNDLPIVSSGRIVRVQTPSEYVETRLVDIWLPEGYPSDEKYNVLYMHDGQALFDSTKTWLNKECKVDENVSFLLENNQIKNTIVVGIHNTGRNRASEYFPQKAAEFLSPNIRQMVDSVTPNGLLADQYLKYIVLELKPFIDANYKVHTGPEHTFIMGSSMGGLISMYAICEYPTIFGGAACMSTHWIGIFRDNPEIPSAFLSYLQNNLPDPANHRIYFDTGDQELDAYYPPYQKQVDLLMQAARFDSQNWITLYFEGDNHSENAWSKRLDKPLSFLLGK